MIYVLSMEGGKYIKVGFTSGRSVESRVASLQTSSPYQLEVLFTVDGTLRQEQALHGAIRTAFHRIRIPIPGNEWYPGKHPFMRELMDALRGGCNSAINHADRYNPSVRQFGTGAKFAEKNRKRAANELWR